MDKGAHFYKCDFQVHTPRDAQWSGGDAVTEAERKAYAEALILACRQKGLDAIAITDHHDFAFFPYVKKAAQNELDNLGKSVPDERKVVVFPGIELTLTSPNCQAILILDAEFPENLLQSVLTALAITPAPSSSSKHAVVQRIPQNVVSDLTDLYDKLNSHHHIKGRFIVFPNVSETGYGTMLRSGFGNFYKTMPCVGGYTDGPVSKFGAGNLSIVRGENRDYGFKAIAILQTSDNRKRDHSDLGKHASWVKWSEPTAEALRQACLAKESRLSHDEPELPSLWITSMSVSNSKFLSRLEIDLNQQYNAIIGGRGTGKSTILEYLRWGLCDQPVDNTDSDIAPVQTRRKKLIDDTLQKVDGEVVVTFLLNDVKHIIKRNSKTQEIHLKIGDADFTQTTEQDVRNLFPVQAYSQKQLSSVGVRIEELKRFVELPIKHKLDQIRSDIRDTEAKIRAAYGNLIRKKEIEAERTKYNLEINSLTKQLGKLRKALKGLSKADQEVIGQKAAYENEELAIENLANELGRVKDLVTTLTSAFDEESEGDDGDLEIQNKVLLKSIRGKYSAKFGQIKKQLSTLSSLFDPAALKEIDDEIKKWDKVKKEFEKKYESAKAKAKANQQQLKQIQDIEKRIAELNKLQRANRNSLAVLGDPETVYAGLRTRWNDLHAQKIQALDEQCQQFSALSDGLIKADIKESLDVESLKQKFKTAFASLNIKEQKIDELCKHVVGAADPIAAWNEILAELEKLALQNTRGTDPLPATAILDGCGLVENEKGRLVTGFNAGKWLELSVTELEFNPVFRYCANKETSEYIEFIDASAGQQATALLTVLLNQPGAPLIIDQPEDDVDSKMSPTIVQQIWKAKSDRQLIFASHNANFVVNGDAELVACCDYVRAGDQTGGRIKAVGAIDNVNIKEEITIVTEGGKQAFKLRMEKYGF
ncbi:MAG TPA: AAA family ATPase [Candidatus Acidoferrales bacterium]|nr:AAA family ATPase [Candidatus Acidoferrales bacterium]